MTRYFINQGKKDGFNPKILMGMINSHMEGKSPEIGQIEIMKMFSFFEMEKGYTQDLQRASKNMEHNGRDVSIEESSPKPSGGGGDRRDRDRGDRGGNRDRSPRSGGGKEHRGGGSSRAGGSHGAKRRRRF